MFHAMRRQTNPATRAAAQLVVAGLVVAGLAVACSGQQAGGQTSGHTGRSATTAGPARVSACGLVTAADVQNVLGQDLGAGELTDNMHTTSTPLDAVEGSDTTNGTCAWVTTGMYVKVNVAAPRTLDDFHLSQKIATGIDNGSFVSTGDLTGLGDGAYASVTSTPLEALVSLSFHQRAYTVSIEVMMASLDSDFVNGTRGRVIAVAKEASGRLPG
jgi:hypothetical protein